MVISLTSPCSSTITELTANLYSRNQGRWWERQLDMFFSIDPVNGLYASPYVSASPSRLSC
eukprot:4146971-Prorocentrum_lima.AAC.1